MFYSRGHSRPLRPAHPPPKRDPPKRDLPPPSYKEAIKNNNSTPPPKPPPVSAKSDIKSKLGLKISNPVLTGSTNKDSQSHVQQSPVPEHRTPIVRPPPPKVPSKAAKPSVSNEGANKPLIKESEKSAVASISSGLSKFGQKLKMSNFTKNDKPVTNTTVATKPVPLKPAVPKPVISDPKQEEETPVVNIVKKRELTRDISNPILISTTDRRSKHLVKNDSFTVNQNEGGLEAKLAPPVPAHISLNRSESDAARRNRPLPSRPLSMQESECGEDTPATDGKGSRKSAVVSSNSPRMPARPPPPPVKPHLDNTRRTIEDELAKLDQINITIPDEGNDSDSGKATAQHPKAKDIKAKPQMHAKKTVPVVKKPVPLSKGAVAKTNSESKVPDRPIQKPVFNPKSRPGLSSNSQSSAIGKKTGKKVTDTQRKVSTDSLDDDSTATPANVSGIAKMFEGQKKPLLGDKGVTRTQSHGAPKAPMTPPKPRPAAKKIRSVDV